ncbi:ATPase family AAA domain-containing protein 2B isoform X3 [Alosa sapidissima]|uniref:ATPase family AAA domain-containing protein 2B isoform X3 n=1 Tax=Alosa sapidissima TaxID=34773 RepID=UPI001C0A01E0|nr:ATPase family AAA domain-containing protein 2B isoform X3 [Alosa sapidissima]
MVNTRKSSKSLPCSPFISSRTRSSVRNNPSSEEPSHKEASSDVSSPSSPRLSPPSKRTRRQTRTPSSSDTSPSPQSKEQRVSWHVPHYCTRLSSGALQNGHTRMSQRERGGGDGGDGDHTHLNGEVRSCRTRKSTFQHLNQSLLFDQLINSTAEAVLQEMDNISSIRQNREVERLRMWTDTELVGSATTLENMDMYSRVKRRKSMRRNSFGIQTHHKALSKKESPAEDEDGGNTGESNEEADDDEDEDDGEEEDDEDDEGDEAEEPGEENDRPYNLRQRKTVQRYEAPPIEPVNRKQSTNSLFDTHRSPARRSHIRIKKHAIHSSDTTSSSDEERFERRKSKSMSRARNRCLPMNLRGDDLTSGVLRDRAKVGASLADVDPMNIDSSVMFDRVGGLEHHIRALKEMVVFPLLYPEVFEKFKIQPPRGCLFYGPPGTGKTLVARALANECSHGDRKVSFFMRKGADCLSKWVGESERQLRLLFDQAYLMRPSIIFFDEIDGLAPVRSSRQDQIHSSIVSTLLALMDGLDSRGEIVVIGATNRIDSIDPALRRPGRFDREFLFNLPDKKARKHILEIHTRDWSPRLAESFVEELAETCVGYCGADLRALCTEAALAALRRRYPQIYGSSATGRRYQLDVGSIVLGPGDFGRALRAIVPAGQRALAPPGRALPSLLRPLLEGGLQTALGGLLRVFPHAERHTHANSDNQFLEEDFYSDEEDTAAPSIYDVLTASPKKHQPPHKPFLHFTTSAYIQPMSYRPRLLLAGPVGSGQSTHLAPALLHRLEELSTHRLDLPTLYSTSTKTPEESCAQVFREARRSVPSVIYMPHVSEWWEAISDTVRSTFLTLLQDIPSLSPILILATADCPYTHLPEGVKSIFSRARGEVVCVSPARDEERRKFFGDLILVQAAQAPPCRRNTAVGVPAVEVLELEEVEGPRQLSTEERRRLEEQEENTLRELRLFLRDVTRRLATDKRFLIFSKPVDIEEVADYLEVIRQPMDLSTIMTKIDTHKFLVAKDFLSDVDLICSNALEYNPDKDPGDKIIRHRACSLKDTAHAMIASELDPEFDRMCEEIKEARRKRDLQSPPATQQQVTTPSPVVTRKPAGEEAAGSSTQGEVLEKHCSNNQLKRKAPRRSSWRHGIIRKKKSYLKKEAGEDQDEEEEEPNGWAESEEAGLGKDGEEEEEEEEESCEPPPPPPPMSAATDSTQHNGHALSTEEESSSEALALRHDPPDPDPNPAHEPQDCVNGDESMSSLDSQTATGDTDTHVAAGGGAPTSEAGHSGKVEDGAGEDNEGGGAQGEREAVQEEESESMQTSVPSASECSEGEHETEGGSRTRKCRKSQSEEPSSQKSQSEEPSSQKSQSEQNSSEKSQSEEKNSQKSKSEETSSEKGQSEEQSSQKSQSEEQRSTSADRPEDLPQPPPPPVLVVDHQRLAALLDEVVLKTAGFSVDELERLYSQLSQAIYLHRRDYNKTQLIEAMERRVRHFETFL